MLLKTEIETKLIMHTVDKKDKDAFLDRVVGIGDVALHFKSKFLIFTLNFNQLPETHRNVLLYSII